MNAPSSTPDVGELIALFYDDPAALGEVANVDSSEVPEDYARLLVHEEHMTVAMEAYHESLVDVEVLASEMTDDHYARKILLRRQKDGAVVQFGIMRVRLASLSAEVRSEIEAQVRPLGRILVRHNLMRTIHHDALWKVAPGDDLAGLFNLAEPRTTFGRTASIDLEGVAAVELLEIVAPL